MIWLDMNHLLSKEGGGNGGYIENVVLCPRNKGVIVKVITIHCFSSE